MAKNKLKISIVISGYVNELVARLHNEYPHRERSGIARVEKRNGYYEVTDIRFPKQSNHGAETEIKDGGLDALLEDIFNTHPEQLAERKCWIHSHHTMGCFRSGTDETAKRSFDDGNLDYRRSIVTAYNDKGNINYKCALNVFKPVNIEFDIPVTTQAFDMDTYLQSNMKDYNVYIKAYKKLEAQRDLALEQLNQPYQATQAEVDALMGIFNVEDTPENREVCSELLERNSKKIIENNKKTIEDTFEEEVEELLSYFNIDMFDDKLKELKDSIIAPAYKAFGGPYADVDDRYRTNKNNKDPYENKSDKEQPLFFGDLDKTKYKNNTSHGYGYEYDRGD